MKKILLALLMTALAGVFEASASHLMGGEITWQCAKSGPNAGRFKLTVKLYRDCNGVNAPGSVTLTSNAPGNASILCNLIDDNDLTPTGPGCPTCANPSGAVNAVEEYIYESAWILINGTPPATGWYFYYDECCRNGAITNLAAGSGWFKLRAIMYPYNATPTNPCFDSSPQFAEKPQLATCTRNETSYNANAVDEEIDSLSYDWGQPLDQGWPASPYPFTAQYSYTNPLPGPAINPLNEAAVMDPVSGVVTFTSYTPGAFVTVTKVTAWKCNQKVAEIFREIQISLVADCIISPAPLTYNTPPTVDPPFPNNIDKYRDTVYVGDTVTFGIAAYDWEVLPNGNGQVLTYTASSNQFGTNYTDPNSGCNRPPCATLNPPPPPLIPSNLLGVNFEWVTDCNHLPSNLGCINLSSTYSFVFKVYDNFCPSPSVNFVTITIVVLAPPPSGPPDLKCASVLPNGNVDLTWIPPSDTGELDTLKYFHAYQIYRSTTGAAGPYTLIDSVMDWQITTYRDLTVDANAGAVHYYIESRSGCDIEPRVQSDTISTIYLQVAQNGTNAELTWSPLKTPLPLSSTRKYYIWKEQLPAGSAIWSLIDSTTSLTYLDPITVCDDSINYKIQVVDTSAADCISESNIDGSRLLSPLPNITAPSLRCVSVLANGDITITWVPSPDTAQYFDHFEIYHSSAAAGPFTSIGTVNNYSVNQFTHAGANGNNASQYYYVTTHAGCDAGSVTESVTPSNTLASIYLQATPAIGFANLSWNPISNPLPATSAGTYDVYRNVPPNVGGTLLANTAATSYQDIITFCDTVIQYWVTIADASGCSSVSSVDTDNFTSAGDVIDNPEMGCLNVQANGDIIITWDQPADPDNFFGSYEIYHSANAAGPFVMLTSINNYATTTYTHIGANGNAAPQYYYLRTLSGCTGTADNGSTGDTLASMHLQVSNAALGFADLTWNAMHNPMLPNATGPYRIMRRTTGVGAYVQRGTSLTLTYRDTIDQCNVPYEYKIELDDTGIPCVSASSAASDVFTYSGNIVPNPMLRCVSVMNNGTIQLTWENPSSTFIDFREYVIYRNNGTGFVPLDSIQNSAINTYLDLTANGNAQSFSYYLTSQSGCTGDLTNGSTGDTLSSIFLSTAPSLGLATLTWTPLDLPLPGTSVGGQYNIYSTYNAVGALQQIGDTALLTYQELIADCDTLLQYQVVVQDALGCSSQSNISQNTFTWQGNIVDNPELRCVSVLPGGNIQLNWVAPLTSMDDFAGYEIWGNSGAGFNLLSTINNQATLTYTDVTADGNLQSYSYYLVSKSGCTGTSDPGVNGNTMNSIFVDVVPSMALSTANWNALSTPLLPSVVSGQYDVWSDYPTGTLAVFGSTAALSYNQPVIDCDTLITWKVSVSDNSGCVSNSNIPSDVHTYIGNIVANPELRCVSVLPNGNIQLNWVAPSGSLTDFNEYQVWSDNGSGFAQIASINSSATLTYTDVTADGNLQSYSYYLTSKSGCTGLEDPGFNGNTMSSIFADVVPSMGLSSLNWNALSSPLLPSVTSGQYDVWSDYQTGTLGIFGSTASLTYNQPVNDCDTLITWKVSVADNSGCVSNSNIPSDVHTYIGNIVANPELRCVSVLPNGNIELSWVTPSGSLQHFNEYQVWSDNGSGFAQISSITNSATTTYTDVTADGNLQSYSYYLTSKSGCTGLEDPGFNGNTMSSIFADVVPSMGLSTLNWNALSSPLLPSVTSGQYDVWSDYQTGTLGIFGSTASLTYNQPVNDCDTLITWKVSVADNSGCVSNSNIPSDVHTYIGNIVANPELRCVDVLANGNITLTWIPSTGSLTHFNEYQVWADNGSGFAQLTSINNSATSTYTDITANGNAQPYSYYLVTKSGCTGLVDPGFNGNTMSSVYLTTVPSMGTATLNWTAASLPIPPSATTGQYDVYSNYNPAGNLSLIGDTADLTYSEPISDCDTLISHQVQLADNSGCVSHSNIAVNTFTYIGNIIDNPELRCVSVLPNGNTELTWVTPAPSSWEDFNQYEIWRNNGSGFILIDSAEVNSDFTYTDINANGQAASISYYLVTKAGCTGMVDNGTTGDTLSSIYLNVVNNNGVAQLNWNPLRNPELATATNQYTVYKEYPAGTWSVLTTTASPDYFYSDTINVCEATINYRIETGDQQGCISVSSLDGDLFRDITRPGVALLDTVSLDPQNPSNVTVTWQQGPSGDTEGYILYLFNGASWDSVGAVTGINNLIFTHNNPNTVNAPQLYSIATYDSCLNVSNLGTSHNTMLLTAKLDVCRSAIDLFWNPYMNMINGIGQYNIYASENGGPLTLIASVPGTNISYSHTNLNNGSEYCYFIQAQGNDAARTASSTMDCETADLLTLPEFSYLNKATVIDHRRVYVECLVDTAGNPDVSRYKLQRSYDKAGPYNTVGVENYNGNARISFHDFTARTDEYSYYYRLVTVDSCGNEVLISNIGRTILLSGRPEFNLTNILGWNDYEEWLGGVNSYSLFRKVDNTWEPVPVVTVPFLTNTHVDDVSEIYQTSGRFCYRIEAYEGPGNIYGFADTSVSNEFCLVQEPHVFVPTAFTPGGMNPMFKPSYVFIDSKNYFFAVYNRWGQKLFETRDPQAGWDGTYDGSVAPEGTYVYSVRVFGTNGQEIEKNGTVTLLR